MSTSAKDLLRRRVEIAHGSGAVRTLFVASAAVGLLAAAGKLATDAAQQIPSPVPRGQALSAGAVASGQARLAEPSGFRPVTAQEALRINATIPVGATIIPAATPFDLRGGDAMDLERAVDCLTSAIYYEAAREAPDGQRAVAQVVLNRVRHLGYPNSVCGVVFEGRERPTGCQFSFTCDGSGARAPAALYWSRSRRIAEAALTGSVFRPVGWATHYHANYVVPYWSASLVKVASIGSHIFYRGKGTWDQPTAFRNTYAGIEPDLNTLWRRGVAGRTATTAPAWRMDAAAEPMPPGLQGAQISGPISRFVLAARGPGDPVGSHHLVTGDVLPQRLRWSLNGAGDDVPAAAGRGTATGSSSTLKDGS